MSETSDILKGAAALIAAAGIGTYNETGAYTAGQTGIYQMVVPDAPDRIITLTWTNQGDNITDPSGQGMLQVRGRGLPGQPMDVGDLLDSIRDILHGRTNLVFGTTTIVQINRRIVAPLGQDDSKRWSRADQYYADIAVAPTAVRPAYGNWSS